MGETGVQHDAAQADSGVVTRLGLCGKCRYNRGTEITPVCIGPLLGGRDIAPCTLRRMAQTAGAECFSDDEQWRAAWKAAALDGDDCENEAYDVAPRNLPPDSKPRIVRPRNYAQRGRAAVLLIHPQTGPRWSDEPHTIQSV